MSCRGDPWTRDREPPVAGAHAVLRTASGTNGEVLETEEWLAPGGAVGIRHPRQEERFSVLSGRLGLHVGRDTRILRPGEALTIEPGVAHRFFNPGDEEAHFLGEVRPALRTEELFERMAALSRREGPAKGKPPGLLTLAPLLFEYRQEVALPTVPLRLQRAALAVAAFVARALRRGELPPLTLE
jgi:mannose-6-phosphate isomerase-like protein (cupin superfamily)